MSKRRSIDAVNMFSDCKLGEVVTVGVPKTHLGQPTAYESRIGGLPVWHDENSAHSGRVSCGACGSAEHMLMVAQIYAPVDCERSLYLFCCNTRRCSLLDEGWKVLRNQSHDEAGAVEHVNVEAAVINQDDDDDDEKAGVSGGLDGASNDWGPSAEGGAFSSLELDSDPGHEDLLTMLAARDDALSEKKRGPSGSISQQASIQSVIDVSSASKSSSTSVGLEWRPSFIVDLQEDLYSGVGAKGNSDSDEEEETALENAAASDGQVQSLLSRYLEDEEDAGLVRRLHGHLKASPSGAERGEGLLTSNEEGVSEDEDNDGGVDIDDHPDGTKAGKRGKEKDFDVWESKLGSNDPKSATEMYFQRRVAWQPRQVVRYAYGGLPLWCTTHQSPDRSDGACVPACESCGAKRVFEFQLMPGVLALKKNTFLAGKTEVYKASRDGSAEEERDTNDTTSTSKQKVDDDKYPQPTKRQLEHMQRFIDDGLDFGVVSVWVCPNTCPGGVEEVAVVQSPPDF